jgi:serine/threonine-protein kinase
MGDVYLADDTLLHRKVALKFLPKHMCNDDDAIARFQKEAQAAARFSHPNIIAIHEVGQFHGRPYLVLEYIKGQTLKDIVAAGKMPIERVYRLCKQICDGLRSAHEAGIIHRDLKLSNIIVDENDRVHIIDFGLAAIKGSEIQTEPGHVMGTSGYMSPEQVAGEPIDQRSDIFAFGIVLYEMLTGKNPFYRESTAATMHAIMTENPDPILRYRDKAPDPLQQIIDKALEKDRNLRYQHIEEIHTDFERFHLGSGISRKTRSYTSNKSRIGLVTLIVLAVLIAAIPGLRSFLMDIFVGRITPPETHLAVLPFVDLSDNQVGNLFCDGLRETLTSSLTQMEQFEGSLLVVPAYEVTNRGVTSISGARKTFGVSMVVTGSVQRLGEDYRLALNLIDTKSERQIKSEVIDVASDELPSLQDSTVSKMSEMLDIRIGSKQRHFLSAGGTQIPEAYLAYLSGLGNLQHFERLASVDSSISNFQRATGLDNRFALAYAGLSDAYWKKYKLTSEPDWVTQSIGNANLALALNDSLGMVHLALGQIYRGTNAYENAEIEYRLALRYMPNNHTALRGLARSLEETGHADDSRKIYEKVINHYPTYWAGHFDLAMFLVYNNQPDQAVISADHAARLVPENARDLNDISAVYMMLQEYDRAAETLKRSIEIEPTYPAYSNLGFIHYMRDEYQSAVAAYERALDINDSDHSVWANLASAYEMQGDRQEEMKEAYEQAIIRAKRNLEVSPRDPIILADLAQYYAMTADTAGALDFVASSLKLGRKNCEVLVRIVFALENIGQRQSAVEYANEAVALGFPASEFAAYPGLEDLINDSGITFNSDFEN